VKKEEKFWSMKEKVSLKEKQCSIFDYFIVFNNVDFCVLEKSK
jgi:hypothetical protein